MAELYLVGEVSAAETDCAALMPAQDAAEKAATRDAQGRWLPGVCVNPGGRRTARITDAIVSVLDAEGADTLVRSVYDAAVKTGKLADKLAVAAWMADRTEGKAVQAHHVEALVTDVTAQRLLELLESTRT